MRLFVAVDIPAALRETIEDEVVRPLGDVPGARWTRPEGRHLTLKFLGNVDDAHVEEVAGVVGSVSTRHPAFRAAFAEIGGFPNLRRPRVLWIGIGEGSNELSTLATDLEGDLEPLGFAAEGRPFRGHLTLARFPKPRMIGELPTVRVPDASFDVFEVVLFRSQLHAKGARYSVVERFPLSA